MPTSHGIPPWFHPRGMKMRLDESLGLSFVQLSASAAFLRISRFYNERRPGPSSPAEPKSFSLQWEIRHSADEITIGTRVVSEDDLRGMFDLPLLLPRDTGLYNSANTKWAHAYIRTIGMTGNAIYKQVIGRPGKFLRADKYLNVPGPGTGCNGDPNVSIEIDVQMRDAVQDFIDNST